MSQNANEYPGVPLPGEVLVGKYRVERVLGVGGMGAVVSAMHLQLEERVAIKFLHPEMAQNVDTVTRFVREGRAAIKIRSEHAVKIHDVGTLPTGAPYLVMEHLDGGDLSQVLDKYGSVATCSSVDLVLQACEAVAEAHGLGIVHRDLKPANLFLTHRADGTDCVKVLDFGISKASTFGEQDAGMTSTQAIMGSPRYMSPEQMRSSRGVDARSDIWSIGVILYELTSGVRPFDGETMTELCAQILQDKPVPVHARRPEVPSSLDVVIQRCLEKSPEARYANLAEFAMAIAPLGTSAAAASAERIRRVLMAKGIGARPVSSPSLDHHAVATPPHAAVTAQPERNAATAVMGASASAVWGSATTPPKAKSGNVALVVVAAVVVLAGAAALVFAGVEGKRGTVSSATESNAPVAKAIPPASASAPPLAPTATDTPDASTNAPSTTLATSAAPSSARPAAQAPPVKAAPTAPPKGAPRAAANPFDGRH